MRPASLAAKRRTKQANSDPQEIGPDPGGYESDPVPEQLLDSPLDWRYEIRMGRRIWSLPIGNFVMEDQALHYDRSIRKD